MEYSAIVRGRLQQDDFIEDDDGGGYADNGLDQWDENDRSDGHDEDSDDPRRSKPFMCTFGA